MADEVEADGAAGSETAAAGQGAAKKKAGFVNLKDPNLLPAAFIAIGLIVGGRLSAPPAPAAAEKPAAEAAAKEDSAKEEGAKEDGAKDEGATDGAETGDVEHSDAAGHSDDAGKDDAADDDATGGSAGLAEQAAPPSTAAAEGSWSYDDPDAWGDLKPEYAACVDGSAQSPIDIRNPLSVGLNDLRFAYVPAALTVRDTGHAVQADVPAGSAVTIDGTAYALRQVHFHAPSEHTVRGRSFPAEVHLVHEADDGGLAVVAMMIEVGPENPVIAALWSAFPAAGAEPGQTAPLDLTTFLPANRSTIRYEGSLTTPPCTEGVRWNLMVAPVPMSQAQLDALLAIHDGNTRPVQPANGRAVVVDSGPDA